MAEILEAQQELKQVRFAHAVPILRVADFDRSVEYYIQRLGFTLDWSSGRFGSVTRDQMSIMLSEGSQGCSSTWLWTAVGDADRLYAELLQRGADIRHPPTNFPWGSREVHVFDPDRHVLRFGSEGPETGPYGPWVDEEGVLWSSQPDGSWQRLTTD